MINSELFSDCYIISYYIIITQLHLRIPLQRMYKVLGIICSVSLMIVPITSSRRLSKEQTAMLHRGKRASCCFVDIFCYTSCFNHGYNLRSLVQHERRVKDPETSRHRHRHHHQHRHRNLGFRTKRGTHDNVLWKKLRSVLKGDQTL